MPQVSGIARRSGLIRSSTLIVVSAGRPARQSKAHRAHADFERDQIDTPDTKRLTNRDTSGWGVEPTRGEMLVQVRGARPLSGELGVKTLSS
jgi:hypothetical protein